MFESVCEPTVAAVQAADPFRLAAALARVTEDRLSAMSADEAECVVAATQRVVNAVSARQSRGGHPLHRACARGAGRAAGRPVRRRCRYAGRGADPAAAGRRRLAPILRIAPRTMVTRIDTAHTLSLLPGTAAMAWAGDLEPYRVSVITRAAREVEQERLGEFEARLHHGDIRELPGSRVKTRAELIAARLAPQPDPTDTDDPTDAEDPEEGSGALRQVRVSPGEQAGLTHWDAQLPAGASVAMWAAVEDLAARYRAGNPQLTVAQSRADALADLVLSDVHVSTTATLIIPTTSAAPPPQPPPPTTLATLTRACRRLSRRPHRARPPSRRARRPTRTPTRTPTRNPSRLVAGQWVLSRS